MDTNDILQEIPDEELLELREIYKNFKPAPYVFSFINTALKWKKRCPEENYLTFYAPNGEWKSDGTFIVHMQWSCFDFFVFTLDPNCKRLLEGFLRTKRFDLKSQPSWLFYAIHRLHIDTIFRIIKELDLEPNHDTKTDIWGISIEEALQFKIECPPEVYIKRLTEECATVINEFWPHKHEGSVDYLKTFIKMNGGYGVFLKENDQLVSCIMISQIGTLAVLQTVEEYKRKGYGTLIMKVLAKEVASEGHVPLGIVLINNTASQSMFQKLGFSIIDQATYVQKEA